MPSISPSEKTSPSILWQRLAALKVFESFSDEERDAFLRAYEHDPALCVRRFAPGDLVCSKGEYELDLCFVLSGSVDLLDDVPDAGRVRIATLKAGSFYGELGALGGRPRTVDIVANIQAEIFYVPRHALKYGRVVSGDCSPETPTEPDVRNYRIRLFGSRLRYAMIAGRMCGCGSG
jgi:CRP-like cAMP-binding protein